jgi:hypothetical protein
LNAVAPVTHDQAMRAATQLILSSCGAVSGGAERHVPAAADDADAVITRYIQERQASEIDARQEQGFTIHSVKVDPPWDGRALTGNAVVEATLEGSVRSVTLTQTIASSGRTYQNCRECHCRLPAAFLVQCDVCGADL